MTAKDAENASFSLRFLSREQSCQKLLAMENVEYFNVLKSVFDRCTEICAKHNEGYIRSIKFTEVFPKKGKRDLLEDAAHDFVK